MHPRRHNRRPLALAPAAQVDVGALLWEVDQRQGSNCHEEVAPSLSGILAAAQATAAGSVERTGGSSGSGRASPEDAGWQLLRAAEDRVSLLQRAYTTITGMQVGPHPFSACMWSALPEGCSQTSAATWVLRNTCAD